MVIGIDLPMNLVKQEKNPDKKEKISFSNQKGKIDVKKADPKIIKEG